MIVAWIIILVLILMNLAIAEGALSYGTLDELTIHGGSTTQRIGNTITRTWSSGWGPLEVKTDVPDYKLFLITIILCSFAIAFAFGMFVVVAFPHWRRMACAAIVIITPALVGGIIALTWWKEAPHLFTWGLVYIAAHTAAQIIGGVGGITIGRPLARLLVRILLPPGIRPRLAYLWLTDGKPLPSPR
ncbi:MAG: hypothetical protein JSV78_01025 [Phycisphaerales bacterium]|nr:MAG: hypothetical protein JSV78_01025 [Phycisphaerales bacterium]